MAGFFRRNPEFEVSALTGDELEAAADLHHARFFHPWSADEIHNLLSQAPVFGFVMHQTNAWIGSPLAGFVLARAVADEAEILTICVAEGFSRAGIGWRLMVAALQEAGVRGAEFMLLEVDAINQPAIGLYRKLGFVEVGRRKAYYAHEDGSRSSALVMRRELG
ncbi:GNAT family N-acetyltransferase [Martelella alba]|uniref:GNAT family N-acetyltransferase n=1 Tax=Martelella alba TaxID=2590451 RepID=A0A506U9U5_9HYPH|nr:N-acetyltransferase [Martelella alba]TPW30126.1 GNAT family N-acetyltransferase [Martelella alba]